MYNTCVPRQRNDKVTAAVGRSREANFCGLAIGRKTPAKIADNNKSWIIK